MAGARSGQRDMGLQQAGHGHTRVAASCAAAAAAAAGGSGCCRG
jgi:hypothetical protein